MSRKLLVSLFIVATFIIWILFDVWLGAHGGLTESMVLKEWGMYSAFFPHLIGFLSGHWFFGRKNVNYSAWGFGLGIWVLLGGWDVYWHQTAHINVHPWFRYPGIWFLTGIPAGMYLWGQHNEDAPL